MFSSARKTYFRLLRHLKHPILRPTGIFTGLTSERSVLCKWIKIYKSLATEIAQHSAAAVPSYVMISKIPWRVSWPVTSAPFPRAQPHSHGSRAVVSACTAHLAKPELFIHHTGRVGQSRSWEVRGP